MAKPSEKVVREWRKLAEKGHLYTEISEKFPGFSVDQVRHYCLGHTGRKFGGPIQEVGRWKGSNVWLRGEKSPHSELTLKQAKKILDDWDEKKDRWRSPGSVWAEKFGVSASTIYMLRRGETWKHLGHPNQGRRKRKKRKKKA